jgi:hypothetical protein
VRRSHSSWRGESCRSRWDELVAHAWGRHRSVRSMGHGGGVRLCDGGGRVCVGNGWRVTGPRHGPRDRRSGLFRRRAPPGWWPDVALEPRRRVQRDVATALGFVALGSLAVLLHSEKNYRVRDESKEKEGTLGRRLAWLFTCKYIFRGAL